MLGRHARTLFSSSAKGGLFRRQACVPKRANEPYSLPVRTVLSLNPSRFIHHESGKDEHDRHKLIETARKARIVHVKEVGGTPPAGPFSRAVIAQGMVRKSWEGRSVDEEVLTRFCILCPIRSLTVAFD